MKKQRIELDMLILRTDELSAEEKQWMETAAAAADDAYAPYSELCVGAVATLSDGTLVRGCNQENAAYPSGLCAERVALFGAAAHYPALAVKALTVVAVRRKVLLPAVAPCGACRQVMLETEQRYHMPLRLLLCGCEEVRVIESAATLLPLAFGMNFNTCSL
jgi:cytidine deaminase